MDSAGNPGGGIDTDHRGRVYALGGTGSYWMESMGNTWGWDDGNFPQYDGLASFVLPFPSFTQPLVDQIQGLAQGQIIDGAAVNCEFECASPLGYIGGWFHTPLSEMLSGGYHFPTTLTDTVPGDGVLGDSGGTVVNLGPTCCRRTGRQTRSGPASHSN